MTVLIADRIERSGYYVSISQNSHNKDYASMESIRGITELAACLLFIRLVHKQNRTYAPNSCFNKLLKYWYVGNEGVSHGKYGFTVSEKLREKI